MLSQVLGWGLLGGSSAVQQFSLQQGQIGLEKQRQGLEGSFPGVGPHTIELSPSKGFHKQDDTRQKTLAPRQPYFYMPESKATSIIPNLNYWLTCLLPLQGINPLNGKTVPYLPKWTSAE